ncbi:hypothetical protein A3860_34115 [Niastella vici]|uniref:Uncharacterized protein n=1 Tax=Niastella vici TaxID=1703345 RepID=A0A1V9FQ85_9BACT|nr:hypothetical protein A3860_34115 [Niastella vici]
MFGNRCVKIQWPVSSYQVPGHRINGKNCRPRLPVTGKTGNREPAVYIIYVPYSARLNIIISG